MSKCPSCNQLADVQKAIVKAGQLYYGCDGCINNLVQGNETAANYSRERMKRDYAGDLAQPINPREFIKAQPEKAHEFYDDDTYRKFS